MCSFEDPDVPLETFNHITNSFDLVILAYDMSIQNYENNLLYSLFNRQPVQIDQL